MAKNDIQSWNLAITFVSDIYNLTKHFPGGESETLSCRIRKAAISLSIALNSLTMADSSGDACKNLYPVLSLASLLETYILIAGEHLFSKEVKLLYQKINGMKEMIACLNNNILNDQ